VLNNDKYEVNRKLLLSIGHDDRRIRRRSVRCEKTTGAMVATLATMISTLATYFSTMTEHAEYCRPDGS
jgi:hypothetical protein